MQISFNDLWKNYPSEDEPCKKDGVSHFSNQCAIRVGVALAKSGYDVRQLIRGGQPRMCWFYPANEGHILSAEELASALHRTTIPGVKATQEIIPGAGFDKKIDGKKGIIFLKDYWARGGETTHRTGDLSIYGTDQD